MSQTHYTTIPRKIQVFFAKKHGLLLSQQPVWGYIALWIASQPPQQQKIRISAMMINQIQLSSKRLQRQLFIVVLRSSIKLALIGKYQGLLPFDIIL